MKRSFLYLFVLTLFALLTLWTLEINDDSSGKPAVDRLLLPGIAERINDVDHVEIVMAGNKVVATLSRSKDRWQIEQMGAYRADWPELQSLLADFALARVVETKTDKPGYYAQLGVEDVAAEDAGSVLVRLGIGDQTTGILIGHQAQGGQGQFVRLQDQAASVLVDRKLDVSTRPSDWADTMIIDVSSSEVAEVEIIHPSAERLMVMRISADQTDFDLAGMPPGREIKNSWSVNSLGSVFSMLNFETVKPDTGVDWSDAVKMRLLMFSGVEIMADMLESGDEYLLRLNASHPAAKVPGKPLEDGEDSGTQQEIEQRAKDDIAKIVEDINQKTAGWAYGISKQKYDALVKKPEDLLKPLES
jgi:hypothetical protein